MADLEVIRIPEDPDVPRGVANKVFRADPGSVLVVTWSAFRWKKARQGYQERTGRTAMMPRAIETGRARWSLPERYDFPGRLQSWLSLHPEVRLLVIADDFVVLPDGMPGGHLFSGPGYCPVCKIWHDENSKGC